MIARRVRPILMTNWATGTLRLIFVADWASGSDKRGAIVLMAASCEATLA